jgi:hypothetical protein
MEIVLLRVEKTAPIPAHLLRAETHVCGFENLSHPHLRHNTGRDPVSLVGQIQENIVRCAKCRQIGLIPALFLPYSRANPDLFLLNSCTNPAVPGGRGHLISVKILETGRCRATIMPPPRFRGTRPLKDSVSTVSWSVVDWRSTLPPASSTCPTTASSPPPRWRTAGARSLLKPTSHRGAPAAVLSHRVGRNAASSGSGTSLSPAP